MNRCFPLKCIIESPEEKYGDPVWVVISFRSVQCGLLSVELAVSFWAVMSKELSPFGWPTPSFTIIWGNFHYCTLFTPNLAVYSLIGTHIFKDKHVTFINAIQQQLVIWLLSLQTALNQITFNRYNTGVTWKSGKPSH